MDSNTTTAANNKNIIRGRDLKLMRIQGKITTSIMAEFLGIRSRKTIENWESEQSTPSINQYILFCKFAGYHPGLVLERIMLRNASENTEQDIELDGCEG